MSGGASGIRWRAVTWGWAAAVFAGLAMTPFFRSLYALLSEPPVERDRFTASITVVSAVSGFLAYLIGGYVTARMARSAGAKNGAMTVVLGLVVGTVLAMILALFGTVSPEGVALCRRPGSDWADQPSSPMCSCSSSASSVVTLAGNSGIPLRAEHP